MHKPPTDLLRSTDGMVDYNRHSSAQQDAILSQQGLIRDLAARLPAREGEYRVADYGCGPGRSAITSVLPALEVLRDRFPDAPLAVCHADQPGNDWNALFALAYGPDGYHTRIGDVRTEAAIGSFYTPMTLERSVDLATCFAASHWLSHSVQLHCPGTLWFADMTGDARHEMEAFARRDWQEFLRLRARELRSGGYLLVSTLGAVPDASEVNGAAASGRGIYRALHVVAEGMAKDGLLDRAVLDRFAFALWFPTAEDARGPIEEDAGLSQSYEIEDISVVPADPNPTDAFLDLLSDPPAYADAYTGYIRAFADTTLRTQLFAPSAGDVDAIADTFYTRLNDLYRTRPGEFAFEHWTMTAILRRR